MAWDDSKDTFRTRPSVPVDEKLTSDEWNDHVTDQKNHSGRHEDGGVDELNVGGLSGVLADAQTPQTEAVQDIVGGLIQANGNISVTYDDGNDTLTIDTSALNEEEVEDAVAALVTAGNAITVNYDDANDSLSIAVDESELSFYDGTNLTANVDNQSVTTSDVTTDTIQESLAIVSPSLGRGYDSVQAAIDAGERHIAVAEDISENDITIPTVSLDEGFILESMGERSTITDPDQDGTPMMKPADLTTNSLGVVIRGLDFQGGAGSGPLLDADFRSNGGTAHRWHLERLRGQNLGPLILKGADEPFIHSVSSKTSESATVTIQGSDYTVGAGLVLASDNAEVRGGQYANQSGAGEYGAIFFACQALSVTGATDITHDDSGSSAVAAIAVDNCSGASFFSPVVEGPAAQAPADLHFTDKYSGSSFSGINIYTPTFTRGRTVVDAGKDISLIKPTGANHTVENNGSPKFRAVESSSTISVTGVTPQNTMLYGGSNSKTGPNQGWEELKQNGFLTQEAGEGVIVTTPDGSAKYRIRVDNSGNVTTDSV